MPDYPRRRLPQDHLPLTVPVFQILLSLSDQDLHGYAIIQDIRERTGGRSGADRRARSTPRIKRLLDAGLVEELDERPRRRRRRLAPPLLPASRRSASTSRGSRPPASSGR